MNNYNYSEGGFNFKRVNKATARQAYDNGLRVVMCPCNLRPGAPWHFGIPVDNKSGATFETALNAFEFYNIHGRETGRYTAFYIPVVTVDRFTGDAPTTGTLGTVEQYDYNYLRG